MSDDPRRTQYEKTYGFVGGEEMHEGVISLCDDRGIAQRPGQVDRSAPPVPLPATFKDAPALVAFHTSAFGLNEEAPILSGLSTKGVQACSVECVLSVSQAGTTRAAHEGVEGIPAIDSIELWPCVAEAEAGRWLVGGHWSVVKLTVAGRT